MAAVGALIVSMAVSVHADEAARRKARYYYSAGMVQDAMGRDDAAYEYYKKAYETDPDYVEAASAYGTRRLGIGMDTLQTDTELDRSLAMMRRYVDAYPGDMYESQYYGFAAGRLEHPDEAVRVLERTYGIHPERTSILLQLSDVYAQNNDITNAIDAIDRYEKIEGLQPQITTRKVSYMLVDKDTVGAIREVSRLVASDTTQAAYRILKGNVFDVIGLPDSAFMYYTAAERIEPESGIAKLALADHYMQRGDSVKYDTKMYEVLLCEDLDLEQKTSLVSQYLQTLMTGKQDTKRGDHLFSVLQNQYPHEPKVLDLAARYSAAKMNFKDAEEQISYALDLDPTNSTYWGQLMTYQSADNRPDDAIATFGRAKKHIEPDENLTLFYGSVAQMAHRYDIAISTYKDMIHAIEPKLSIDSVLTLRDVRANITMSDLDMLSKLFTTLGDVYHADGEFDMSYRAYDNAIVFDSSNSMAKNNYAYFLCTHGGDLDKAMELSQQAIGGIDADNPTYLDTYAWICHLKGDNEKAEEVQLRALENMEKDGLPSAELYDHLGDILEANGKLAEAVDAWRKALKVQEDSEETTDPTYKMTQRKVREAEPKLKDLPQKAAEHKASEQDVTGHKAPVQ